MPDSMRACGACSLCCKLLPIAALDKPADRWCTHSRPGAGGCMIYDERPETCHSFQCAWIADEAINDHWNPLHSKMVMQITNNRDANYDIFIDVHVDRGAANIWRTEPYYSELRRISQAKRTLVRVFYGPRVWMIFPDGDAEIKKNT